MAVGESWGRYPTAEQHLHRLQWRDDIRFPDSGRTTLSYGLGRSYGDCCLNDGGELLITRGLNRLISFDPEKGILRCEAGVSLQEVLRFSVPRGWFVPVSPGTKFVTIGGAVANDVHGKNHHGAGTFGCHVLSFELARSDGRRVQCSPKKNKKLFAATIGGLGLTGVITWVEFQLQPLSGPMIDLQSIQFSSLDEFFSLSEQSDQDYEYTVSWIDAISGGDGFGRGIFMRGNHSDQSGPVERKSLLAPFLRVPFSAPSVLLNRFTVGAFNTVYYHKQFSKQVNSVVHYDPFFYPLDSIQHWNRIYGKRGFLQFQCVVPKADNNLAIRKVLNHVVRSGKASFLAVIKEFGEIASPGMLSFPRPGVTLCLDFPFDGQDTLDLMSRLDDTVADCGGALYPAKDAAMSPQHFREYFPRWQEFSEHIDPSCSSSFWRRVTA